MAQPRPVSLARPTETGLLLLASFRVNSRLPHYFSWTFPDDVPDADLFSRSTSEIRVRDIVRKSPGEIMRSEEHTSELQSPDHLLCRLLLEKKKLKTHIQK